MGGGDRCTCILDPPQRKLSYHSWNTRYEWDHTPQALMPDRLEAGPSPCYILKKRSKILYWDLYSTEIQWRAFKIGVICDSISFVSSLHVLHCFAHFAVFWSITGEHHEAIHATQMRVRGVMCNVMIYVIYANSRLMSHISYRRNSSDWESCEIANNVDSCQIKSL